MGQAQRVTNFMNRDFPNPLENKGPVRRETVKLIAKTMVRNDCNASTQCGFPKHIGQDLNEEIMRSDTNNMVMGIRGSAPMSG